MTYTLTEVNDKKFTLTLKGSIWLNWFDSRIKLDNLTNTDLRDVIQRLVREAWQPEVLLTNLESARPMQFISQETLSE